MGDCAQIVASAVSANLSLTFTYPFVCLRLPKGTTIVDQGRLMTGWATAKIQLCGRFVVNIDGSRIEDTLPGRKGRILFAYLVLNRGRALPRDELLMAGWGADAPAEARNALSVLLSKLRHGVGEDQLQGRTEIELLLPHTTFVDVKAALEGAHRAETWIATGRWAQAWGPAGIAYHVATRPF